MKIWLCSLLLVLPVLAWSAPSQQATDPRLHAIYSNFVGDWEGQHQDFTKQPVVVLTLKVSVREEPQKGRLRFDYFYGTKGTKSYEHSVRFMKIDPDKGTVLFNWADDDHPQPYPAEHLADVLPTGRGEFQIHFIVPEDGRPTAYRASFHLTDNQLDYSWEKSLDGTAFSQTSRISLRKIADSNSLPTAKN